jgi:hypothetical protein
MVRGGLLVHGPAFTPFCPAEADYADDPELDLAQSGDRGREPLWCAVFPASPAHLEIWGMPTSPTTPTSALRRLSIALSFPDGETYAAVPAWNDTFHQWQHFVLAGSDLVSAPRRGPGREIFVPDDINLMKTVQARILEQPPDP